MFQELDIALDNMLSDKKDPAIPDDPSIPAELKNADKSFVTPDKNFKPLQGLPTVDLFLYDVKENRELRDPVPIVEKIGNTFVRRQSPLRIDCSYIVTAWSNTNQVGETKVAEEHLLLSQAVQWLSRFSTIPDKYLPADWKDKTNLAYQPFTPPMWIAQMDPNKNAGEFWVALGVSPRSAFYLTVTIAMELGVQVPEGPPVTTRISEYQQSSKPETAEVFIEIGGHVRTGAPPQAVSGAWVRLEETGGAPVQTTTTNAEGRFTFAGLIAGNYSLRVRAQGFNEGTRNIEVPSMTGDYDVQLI